MGSPQKLGQFNPAGWSAKAIINEYIYEQIVLYTVHNLLYTCLQVMSVLQILKVLCTLSGNRKNDKMTVFSFYIFRGK